MDALPADPPAEVAPAPPPSVSAVATAPGPGDLYGRTPRERELCQRASHPDWLYLGVSVAAVAGAIYADGTVKYKEPELRALGAGAVGASWGFLVGGFRLALAQCSPTWIGEPSREDGARREWPLALAFAVLAGATAPMVMGIEQGFIPPQWTVPERQARLFIAGGVGFGAALLPYLIPPTSWSASRELHKLRVYGDEKSGFVGYGTSF